MTDTHEITVAAPQQIQRDETPQHPMMQIAMQNPDVLSNPDILKGLIEANEMFAKSEAQKAFNRDLVMMKGELPATIPKNKKVSFHAKGRLTEYSFASLDRIVGIITPILTKHGFALVWHNEHRADGRIVVVAVLAHRLGHSMENASPPVQPDASGGKNNIQAAGSSITYMRRYTALSLLGIVEEGSDDDAQSSEEYIDSNKNLAAVSALQAEGIDLQDAIDEIGKGVKDWTNFDLETLREMIRNRR